MDAEVKRNKSQDVDFASVRQLVRRASLARNLGASVGQMHCSSRKGKTVSNYDGADCCSRLACSPYGSSYGIVFERAGLSTLFPAPCMFTILLSRIYLGKIQDHRANLATLILTRCGV